MNMLREGTGKMRSGTLNFSHPGAARNHDLRRITYSAHRADCRKNEVPSGGR